MMHPCPARRGPEARLGQSAADAVEVLPRQRLQPDTRHRFLLTPQAEIDHVRLDVYPDGGMARLRLWGELSRGGRDELTMRWYNSMTDAQTRAVLAGFAGLSADEAAAAVKVRPALGTGDLPEGLRAALGSLA